MSLCYVLFILREMDADICTERGEKRITVLSVNRYFWLTVTCLLLLPSVTGNEWYSKTMLYKDLETLGSKEKFSKAVASSKDELKKNAVYEELYADIQDYPDKTLGMLSAEQSFFIAYDLMDRVKINPMVSLLDHITPYTELMTVAQYSGEQAPDVLFYHPENLDGDYYVFRMGTILQSLLENYEVKKVDANGYLVLQHKEENGQDGEREPYALGEPQVVRIGEEIEVPKADNAYVFMKVDWDLTPLGRLASFVFKPTRTWVDITTDSGGVYTYRFLRKLAENGIYVSNLADTSAELAELFSGDTVNSSIKSIRFTGNKLYYDQEMQVSFYAVPFTEAQKNYQYQEVTFNFLDDVEPGDYQVFYGQNDAFTWEKSKSFYVGEHQRSLTTMIPDGEWNTVRLDFPLVDGGIYDLESVQVGDKEVRFRRVKDVQYTQSESGLHIVTGNSDPYVVFDVEYR